MASMVSGLCLTAQADATPPISTLFSLCHGVDQTGLFGEEGWVLKHRGREEHRGKGLRMRGKMGDETRLPVRRASGCAVPTSNFVPLYLFIQ